MKSESEIMQDIRLASPGENCHLMRNNVGVLRDVTGRPIRYGLLNETCEMNSRIKSSDLIGITVIKITPDMVGQNVAVFTAIECKSQDWKPSNNPRERAQNNFIAWVLSLGGFAGFAKSVDDFRNIIRR